MSRVQLTPEIEERMVAAIGRDQDTHITMPRSAYRADGSLLVSRDGLAGVRAQRHLYRRLIGPLEPHQYLRKRCIEKGCVNPYHYRVTERSREGFTHCRKGHPYTPENTLPDGQYRCRTCRDADLERRRARYRGTNPHPLRNPAELNRAKTACDHGHEFTPENTYERISPAGKAYRQCRTCAILRARERAKRIRDQKLQATTELRKAS